ncbi:hypothetical protein, partial [Klebsiella pneumoniae]|uniref:hypothetical protein n=1 Tax=Klebsiella pneumoniae TaxID=573 RepID=UPI001962CAAB
QTETEATGAPQKHHYTLNQQVGSITDPPLNGASFFHSRASSVGFDFFGNFHVLPYAVKTPIVFVSGRNNYTD